MKLFVGLDVSVAKTAICVISEHGNIVREAETTSEPEVLSRWLGELDGCVTEFQTLGCDRRRQTYKDCSKFAKMFAIQLFGPDCWSHTVSSVEQLSLQ